MKLRDLVEQIRIYEDSMAYGSETSLWGAFVSEYRDKIEDYLDLDTTDVDIPDEDGDVWLAAYKQMEELEENGEDYNIEDLF